MIGHPNESVGVSQTIGPESVHGVIEMGEDVPEGVRLVRVRLLLEHYVAVHQSLVQHHGLLVVHVVVRCPVYQHVLFPSHTLHPPAHVRVVVTALIVLRGRQAHEPFRVQGI